MLKNKLLNIFLENQGEILTGGYLAKKLDVSRTAIWKSINALKNDGVEIETYKNKGYKFIEVKDVFQSVIINKHLNTKEIGQNIEVLETVVSTNTYLKEKSNLPNGYSVVSNEQTGGKGRMGRTFCSPKDNGIYLSIFLTPNICFEKMQLLTICTAISVVTAIKNVCNINTSVKWVNDIYYNYKKLCGILTECTISAETKTVDTAIIGIGINTKTVAEDVMDIATSIYNINGMTNIKNQLVAEILNQFEINYNKLLQGNFSSIIEDYTKSLFIIGKTVTVLSNNTFDAVVQGINEKGELIVIDNYNNTHYLNSGEVSLKI